MPDKIKIITRTNTASELLDVYVMMMMMIQYLVSEATVMDTGTGQTTLHQFTLKAITGKCAREEEVSV
jgi:hypothetical protein